MNATSEYDNETLKEVIQLQQDVIDEQRMTIASLKKRIRKIERTIVGFSDKVRRIKNK